MIVGLFWLCIRSLFLYNRSLLSSSTEMILSTLNHDASMLRAYIIKESSSSEGLLPSLIHALLHYQDTGLKAQIADIVKNLLGIFFSFEGADSRHSQKHPRYNF